MISKKALALEAVNMLSEYLDNRIGGKTQKEKDAINAITAYILMDEQPGKWVPVSKELPEERGEYLTTNMFGTVYCDYWDGDRFDRTETVLAWMNKPAPYEWGKGEDNAV